MASFVERTLDRAREIVFDSAVLTGDPSAELHARLDAVRGGLARLMTADAGLGTARPRSGEATGGAPPGGAGVPTSARRDPAPGAHRRARTPGSARAPTAPRLAEVVQEAHERALRSFEDLHFRSWGRRAGMSPGGVGFPGPGPSRRLGRGRGPAPTASGAPGWAGSRVGSRPLRALLGPLAPVGPRAAPRRHRARPVALAILGEEPLHRRRRLADGSAPRSMPAWRSTPRPTSSTAPCGASPPGSAQRAGERPRRERLSPASSWARA